MNPLALMLGIRKLRGKQSKSSTVAPPTAATDVASAPMQRKLGGQGNFSPLEHFFRSRLNRTFGSGLDPRMFFKFLGQPDMGITLNDPSAVRPLPPMPHGDSRFAPLDTLGSAAKNRNAPGSAGNLFLLLQLLTSRNRNRGV